MTESVSFKLERRLLVRIDGIAPNRSEFIREAVEEKLQRSPQKGRTAWDILQRSAGLKLNIPKAKGKVKRITL